MMMKSGRTGRCLSFWLERYDDLHILEKIEESLGHGHVNPHCHQRLGAIDMTVLFDVMGDSQGGGREGPPYPRRGGITAPYLRTKLTFLQSRHHTPPYRPPIVLLFQPSSKTYPISGPIIDIIMGVITFRPGGDISNVRPG
jgi:hypothetical protein